MSGLLTNKKIIFAGFIAILAIFIGLTANLVSEKPYKKEAPEKGDEYFEMIDDEGEWISYVNPRDQYTPENASEGGANGRLCVTLFNEQYEPITGETIQNTTFSVNITGLEWHNHTNPFKVKFPLTEHYERPLDSDHLGKSKNLPQGDGFMDSHCVEWHSVNWKGPGHLNDTTIQYTQGELKGEHAEDLKIKGYYEKMGTWETNIDPKDKLTDYGSEIADGAITYRNENHGEIWIALKLDRSKPEIIQERLKSLFSNSSSN